MGIFKLFIALHIIFVVTWFAALFYLPRLFVYHTKKQADPAISKLFKIMESKLLFIICIPSCILCITTGVVLVFFMLRHGAIEYWLFYKVMLVAVLVAYNYYCLYITRELAKDNNPHTEFFYRVFNEFPTIILFAVIFLVIFKP